MLRIGLMGGIGSGKSEAAAVLRRLGADVIEADAVARELVAPGSRVLDEIVDAFGSDVLRPDGTLDRPRLGRRAFSDPALLARLNGITHPPLIDALMERVESTERRRRRGVVVVDAALLADWDVLDLFDVVVAVTAPPEVRLSRTIAGGLSEDEARARAAAQTEEADLAAMADVVIENAGTLEDLERAVREFWQTLPAGPRSAAEEARRPTEEA